MVSAILFAQKIFPHPDKIALYQIAFMTEVIVNKLIISAQSVVNSKRGHRRFKSSIFKKIGKRFFNNVFYLLKWFFEIFRNIFHRFTLMQILLIFLQKFFVFSCKFFKLLLYISYWERDSHLNQDQNPE